VEEGEEVMNRIGVLVNADGSTRTVSIADIPMGLRTRWLRVAYGAPGGPLLCERFYERATPCLAIAKTGDEGDDDEGAIVFVERGPLLYSHYVEQIESSIREAVRDVADLRRLYRISEIAIPEPVGDA
jgi:hypothetical protein